MILIHSKHKQTDVSRRTAPAVIIQSSDGERENVTQMLMKVSMIKTDDRGIKARRKTDLSYSAMSSQLPCFGV